jgi:hypothetical protein
VGIFHLLLFLFPGFKIIWNSENSSSTGEVANVVWFVELLDSESVTEIEDYTNKVAWCMALWNGKVVIFNRNDETSSDEMTAALSQDTLGAQ